MCVCVSVYVCIRERKQDVYACVCVCVCVCVLDRESFLIAQLLKNPPATQETPVHFLSSIPLSEKAMATHSSTLAWTIPGMEEPGGLPSMGSHRVGHD